MADGDIVRTNPGIRHVKFMDAADATGATTGLWVDMRGFGARTHIDASGIAGGAVLRLCGSNAASKPADATNGETIQDYEVDGPADVPTAAFMKAYVQTVGTGTPSLIGLSRRGS